MKTTRTGFLTVADINNRDDLHFVVDSQDVNELKSMIPEAIGYDSFLVAIDNGAYTEVWAMHGIVPYLYKKVYQLPTTP